MMKMVIAAVAGLLLGVGGGTGFVMMRHEPAPAVADGVAADSTHLAEGGAAHGEAAAEADAHEADGAHDAATPTDVANAASPQPNAPGADGHATPDAATSTPAKRSASAEADSTFARLSRIFGAMKPADAAVVLEKLDDASVRMLLLNLSDRKAAAILSSMPGEKAAMVTRTMLSDARGG